MVNDRRHLLFKKQKKLLMKYYDTVQFKEPIAILLRRNHKAEFYEDVSKSDFKITHTDGEERTIHITPQHKQVFDYGNKQFVGYILHEDFPTPLPEEPTVTAEMVGIAIEKTLNDIKKWKAEEWRAKGEFFWKILIGIAIVIGAYVLYKMLVPDKATTTVEVPLIQNLTQTITNATNVTIIR